MGIDRAEQHQSPLFFDLGEHEDVISLLPWGPISLWGPTETAVKNISDGAGVTTDEVDFLLTHDISVFSLQGGKLAPTGEGGMFLCKEVRYWERAVCFGDITRIIELETPARRFAASSFGIKTRIAPISAAIARNQLARLNDHNRKRNHNLQYLSADLGKFGIHTFLPPDHIQRVYFEYLVRPDLVKIGLPMNIFIEALNAEMMKLPSFPAATAALLDQYLFAFERVVKHAVDIARHFR